MSAVSNQLPYKPLEPIPITNERFIELRNLAIRVTLIYSVVALFTVFGIGLSLSGFQFSLFDSAFISGTIGLITSLALVYFWKLPAPYGEYRLGTLSQMETILGSKRGKMAIEELKNFFYYPFKRFHQTYQNHMLHNLLYSVSEQIPSDREDVQKVWEVFLNHLKQKKVQNADGQLIELDFTTEIARIKEPLSIPVNIEKLHRWSPSYDDDLKQVEEIQKISFGTIGLWTKEMMKAKFKENSNNGGFVAKRPDTNKILAFVWYTEEKDEYTLSGLAKDPDATGPLHLGNRLMHAFLEQIPRNKVVKLQVRKSNPAIQLYKQWGFEEVKELPKYYRSGPPEDAWEMHLKWDTYLNKRSQAGAS